MNGGRFYFMRNKQQHGPISRDELQALCGSGQVSAGDFVWQEGTPTWAPASRIAGLVFGSAPVRAAAAVTPLPTETVFHYAQNGQQRGPVSLEQLKGLATAGQLQASDLVWQAGTPNWVPAEKIPGLISQAAALQPAPTPQPVATASPQLAAPAVPQPAPAAGPRFYYNANGKQAGPVPRDQLLQMATTGELAPDQMVWQEGTPSWVAARQIEGLTFASSAAAPAPVVRGLPFSANRIAFQYPEGWNTRIKEIENLPGGWFLQVQGNVLVPETRNSEATQLILQCYPSPPHSVDSAFDATSNALRENATLKNMALTPASGTLGGQAARALDYRFGIKASFWSTTPYTGQLYVAQLGERVFVLFWHASDVAFPSVKPLADLVRNSLAIASAGGDTAKPGTFSANGIEFQHPAGASATLEPMDKEELIWSISVETTVGSVTMDLVPAVISCQSQLDTFRSSFSRIPMVSNLNFTASSVKLGGTQAEGFNFTYLQNGAPASGQAHAAFLGNRVVMLRWFAGDDSRADVAGAAELIRSTLKVAD